MTSTFRIGWRRFVPAIGYHHVLMVICIIAIVAWSIVLGGCSSSTGGMNNVYILSVSYNTPVGRTESTNQHSYLSDLINLTNNANLEVRGGFFGLCVQQQSLMPGRSFWDCAGPSEILGRYGEDVDPLGLVDYVYNFVKKIEFYGLILGSQILTFVSVLGFATFPGWHTVMDDDGSEREVKPFPSRSVSQGISWLLAWAVGLGFVSILWIHIGAVAAAESLQTSFGPIVSTKLGAAIMSLGWVAVALTCVALTGVIIMILAIQLLDRLTDDD